MLAAEAAAPAAIATRDGTGFAMIPTTPNMIGNKDKAAPFTRTLVYQILRNLGTQ
ncbi:MAG TPA: hypothetical protein VN325_41845 [Steroidobacteraceae bacterium]|nr:hypothetical protein [Steroidobacteraceae bacterium]